MRPRFYKYLSFQLILIVLLPTLLIGSAMSVPMIGERREQLIGQERLRALQAGRTLNAIYAERLKFANLLVELLSNRSVLIASLSAKDINAMQSFVQQTRKDTLFDLVTIVDQHGELIAQDGMTELWKPDQVITTSTHFWSVPGKGLAIEVSRSIANADNPLGTFIGTFVIDNAFLTDMRARTDLDQSILFGNQLVATSLRGRTAPDAIALPDDVVDAQVLAEGMQTFSEVQINHDPYLTHYTPLRSPDNQVIGMIEILLPLASVHTAQNEATFILLFTTLLAAWLAVVLSWLLARRLTRPIRALLHVAESIGAGDLDRKVVIGGPTELRTLGRAIERMRRQLSSSHAALEAEKSRYKNILESVEEAVITLDPAACVTSLNRSAEALLGCTRESVRGRMLHQVVHTHQDTPLALEQIPLLGTSRLAICGPQDRVITIEATRSSIHASPDAVPPEHILVLRDVSEDVAVAQLKEAFLANITHEFQTPLAALIASLEILREGDDGGNALSASEQQAMLTTIHIGVQRLDLLVRNLLDSASLQAGYFRVTPDVSYLKPLITEAVEIVQPLIRQQQQTVQLSLPEDLPPIVADDRRVVQVLINLLSNASKFGPRGDTLQLTAAVAGTEITIGVTDHGPGIAAQRQQHLFERFLRPGSETVRAQGVGLGLAIVKAIVERHGGRVHVQSHNGNETTFMFTLRLAL